MTTEHVDTLKNDGLKTISTSGRATRVMPSGRCSLRAPRPHPPGRGLCHRRIPDATRAEVGRVFLTTAALAAVAAPVNAWLGTNYLYLAAKPEVASLMDYLGPWPWYILSLVPMCLLFLFLWYSPFWIADRIRRRREQDGKAPGG